MDRQKSTAIRKTLDQIGVKHNIKGYSYIIRAIEMCLEDRNKLNYIVKGIYAEIAQENNDKVTNVERAMRHAIEVSWKQGNLALINRIFGYTVSSDKGKPTNSEFVALITDFISLYWEEIANDSYKWQE